MGLLDDVPSAAKDALPVEPQACLPGLFAHAVKPKEQAQETLTCKGKSSAIVAHCTQCNLES